MKVCYAARQVAPQMLHSSKRTAALLYNMDPGTELYSVPLHLSVLDIPILWT